MKISRRSLMAASVAVAAVDAVATAGVPRAKRLYRRLSVEEGFTIPEVDAANAALHPNGGKITEAHRLNRIQAFDIGEGRIAGMDAAGVDIQLLLLAAPGVQALEGSQASELATLVNDRAAEATARYPTRLAALTAIAPQNPVSAARELERGVKKLGFKGAVINSHTRGEYLDDVKFWPIFEAAQALDVPIYLHPRDPSFGVPGPLDIAGLHVGWGYGVEAGTHLLRIILAGVFDEFPRLRLVVGHLGEMIPFYFDRIDNRLVWESRFIGLTPKVKKRPSSYFYENIYLTSSGVNYWEPVKYTIDRIGVSRLMFAADYPYEDQDSVVKTAETFPMDLATKKAFFEENAARVFRI